MESSGPILEAPNKNQEVEPSILVSGAEAIGEEFEQGQLHFQSPFILKQRFSFWRSLRLSLNLLQRSHRP